MSEKKQIPPGPVIKANFNVHRALSQGTCIDLKQWKKNLKKTVAWESYRYYLT